MVDLNSKSMKRSPFVRAIDAIFKPSPNRGYLGASTLGDPCSRKLQYQYFNAPRDKPIEPRIYRIFHRGHKGENWMVEWMIQAGFKMAGQQAEFKILNGKVQGHCDGVITDGPESCGPYPRLWECKVLGAKGWRGALKHGVQKHYPIYYGQIQIYQTYLDLAENPALFTALNADTMEIYDESIPFDAVVAQQLSDKAFNIIDASDSGIQLPSINDDPEYYLCKWCDYARRCHDN